MHNFDYSFLKEMTVSTAFATRLARIEGLRTKSASFVIDYPNTAKDMRELAKIMSVRESNAIEGISTEDSRLLGLLTGRVQPKGHNEYEILGYRDALNRIHNEHSTMDINEETILNLFTTMISYTDAEPGYKVVNNEIVDRDADGRIVKRYKVVPASQVEESIYQLLGAFIEARSDMGISDILLIPCFIMDFLRIHPFLDGNGRMSRLLTILLMYQKGLDVCAYVSIEAIINQSKADYYAALEQSGEGWFDNISDYGPFIEYMIGAIFLAYREMDRRMAICIGKDNRANRIERLVTSVSIPISKKEVCALIPEVSETYVELILSRLLEEGKIEKLGSSKSARYLPK